MMRRKFGCVTVGLFVVCLAVPCLATIYSVGDSAGWALGVNYDSWSSSKTFVVGDSLVFNYGSGHTVDEVSQSDYSTCTDNPMSTDNTGSTTILLQTPGPRYFICGIVGHCSSGMKLSVNVKASGASSSSSSPNSTASGTPTTTASGCGTPGGIPVTPTVPTMFPYSASSPRSLSGLHGPLIVFATALAFKLPLL